MLVAPIVVAESADMSKE